VWSLLFGGNQATNTHRTHIHFERLAFHVNLKVVAHKKMEIRHRKRKKNQDDVQRLSDKESLSDDGDDESKSSSIVAGWKLAGIWSYLGRLSRDESLALLLLSVRQTACDIQKQTCFCVWGICWVLFSQNAAR
jgi:hypothetical protein